ncbi:MAG: hypothetical protein PUP91_32500 [Rhizonema sp. PD37]|nr:hypothetical protein [Rhizonema sp. PD37]
MDGNQKKYIGRLEINDLIDDAVNNAVARRSLSTNSDDALSALSYDEAARIAGGLTTSTVEPIKAVCPSITLGLLSPIPPNQQTS